MKSDEKKKSICILPKVEDCHYKSGLENLAKDYEGMLKHLKDLNPEVLMLMQMQSEIAHGQEDNPIFVTVVTTYSLLREAAKNHRLPMVSRETLQKIMPGESPKTESGLVDYVNDNYSRIRDENPKVAYLLADIIHQFKERPNAKVSILLTGITLYRILEEQMLNTH